MWASAPTDNTLEVWSTWGAHTVNDNSNDDDLSYGLFRIETECTLLVFKENKDHLPFFRVST